MVTSGGIDKYKYPLGAEVGRVKFKVREEDPLFMVGDSTKLLEVNTLEVFIVKPIYELVIETTHPL